MCWRILKKISEKAESLTSLINGQSADHLFFFQNSIDYGTDHVKWSMLMQVTLKRKQNARMRSV